ncbi:MAG: hypothetical protein OJF59_001062 [Cytophagales bacterium]|jgi:putative Mn2+ efflux pump MntP|nr:hypothetical protein [Bacteroidota bacterium]MBS1979944.1 hypothetical protein [Bacteroidota bacterium]WHZ07309.1 MAG: hypothetical protein OJF59_001062 [Cytophagales bacterium]
MYILISGSVLLSLLHAVIPNHWLPVLAVGKKEKWSLGEILEITALCALSHVFSTLLIGWGLVFFGWKFSQQFQSATRWLSPGILILIGLVFIYRHYRHKHFHVAEQVHQSSKTKMIASLSLAMFLSPCLEVEAYFLAAGTSTISVAIILSIVYSAVTILGMVAWIYFAYHGTSKFNWHRLEHNAGIITGVTIIASGVISFFIK